MGAKVGPAMRQTSRAVAPPDGTGDAIAFYYSQARSRQEAGLLHFRGFAHAGLSPAHRGMKIGLNRGRATTRVALTMGLRGPIFVPIREQADMATGTDRSTATKRAAIYARVSDKSQDTEDKTSISEQISDMEAHSEHRGLTITARYQEVGRGWSKNRPEFKRMLADARRGRFDTIV